jgi:mRNA interferase MazF
VPLYPGIVPKPGEIFVCDFSGYIVPEIVKTRRVVVVSPRHTGAPLALVAPISTSAPRTVLPIHARLPGQATYRCFWGADEVWVKGDLIAHVCYDRLNKVRIPKLDEWGNPIRSKYEFLPTTTLSSGDFKAVRQAILHALGLGRLASQV